MSGTRIPSPADSGRPPSGSGSHSVRPGLLLAVVLAGEFMASLDVTIVNVATATIQRDLHASGAGLQMVVAGYVIAYAVLLITGARLGQRHGYGRAFQLGLAGFTMFSLACGLAPDTGSLIGFRLAQGLSAAVMVPQVVSLIQRTFSGASRARALSVYTAVIAAGTVVGQVLGGLLVSADIAGSGWRPVFLVNVPIGVVLLIVGRRLFVAAEGDRDRTLDLRGLLVLAAAIGLFVVPLVLGHEVGWPAWTWAMLIASALAFALFVRVERRVAKGGGSPLIPSRVLRSPGLIPASVALFLQWASFSGFTFAFALHMQEGLGYSALRSGLFSLFTIGFGVAGLTWHRLPRRLHLHLPMTALVVIALTYAAAGLVLRSGHDVGVTAVVVLVLLALACGCTYGPLFGRGLGGVRPVDAADASGVMITIIQLGQVVGISLPGTLFLSRVTYPAPPVDSGHALAVTGIAVAAAAAVGAGFAHRTRKAALHP
ncbi:MFS transporter [Streptomyces sp. ME03-5709C]|nr:MFS transporter [Streptomyces sp. ME03-5709C]